MRSDSEVGLAAGDGLGATAGLMRDVIVPALGLYPPLEDGRHITLGSPDAVITADLYTVDPIVFPGGDIGRLAACGAVNDLLAAGAVATGATVGLLLAPELPRSTLSRVLTSLRAVLDDEGAQVWAGDTKVVRGLPHGIAIAMTAVGRPLGSARFDLSDTREGDALIVTGALGAHSVAVLSAREGLGFERVVSSDVGPLRAAVEPLIAAGVLRSIRDLTRGGLVGALWDGVSATGLDWVIDGGAVPIEHEVRAATELLGLDPLALTNEGCLLLTTDPAEAERVVAHLAKYQETFGARVVGRTTKAQIVGNPVVQEVSGDGPGTIVRRPDALGVPYLC